MAPHADGMSGTSGEKDPVATQHMRSSNDINHRLYTVEDLIELKPAVEIKATDNATNNAINTEAQTPSLAAPTESPASVSPVAIDDEDTDENKKQVDDASTLIPKKKKKKKSSSKNKAAAPTGFEEFYADPPLTPAEYYEEVCNIYYHERSFVERIEQCIQRYRARRKLDSTRANYFTKFLTLGGIDSGLKSFTGGLDKETLDSSTAEQIADIAAKDYIHGSGGRNSKFYDPSNTVDWVVDFESIVKGFLSHKVVRIFGTDTEEVISGYTGVIRNFLNYVLTHSVCPEYTHNILAAKAICDLAEKELWAIKQVSMLLPGDFNKAASTLYGGYFKEISTPFQWTGERSVFGMSEKTARRVFLTAVSWLGTEKQSRMLLSKQPIRIIKEEVRPLEVVGIELPDFQMQRAFGGTKDENGVAGMIKPMGFLEVKHWVNPEGEEEDMTDDEEEDEVSTNEGIPANNSTEKFWLEGEILQHCFIGMKFEATVHELNVPDLKYIDFISGIYCSFFTYLPNERMSNWKEPVENTRPAPTVDGLGDNHEAEGDNDDGFE